MSLKAFHLLFIFASIILCLGYGYWCFQHEMSTFGALSLAGGIGLIAYFIWFITQLKSGKLAALALLIPSFLGDYAIACSACAGNPSAPLTKAANTGILFLLGVVSIVLAGFASIFITWMIRAKKHSF